LIYPLVEYIVAAVESNLDSRDFKKIDASTKGNGIALRYCEIEIIYQPIKISRLIHFFPADSVAQYKRE